MKTKIDIEKNRDTYKISVRKGDGKPTKVETGDRAFARNTLLSIMDDAKRDFFPAQDSGSKEERLKEWTVPRPEPVDDSVSVTDKPEKTVTKDSLPTIDDPAGLTSKHLKKVKGKGKE